MNLPARCVLVNLLNFGRWSTSVSSAIISSESTGIALPVRMITGRLGNDRVSM